jgi:hypothetical protein
VVARSRRPDHRGRLCERSASRRRAAAAAPCAHCPAR